MIDVETDARCKACNKPLVRVPGRRPREYCDNRGVCRQKYYREHHQVSLEQTALDQQNITMLQEKLRQAGDHIQKLERQVEVQKSRINELTVENRTLRTSIDQARDIEEAFSTDTSMHSFKKWLRSHQYHAERPGCKKILEEAYGFPPAGSRGTYTEAMRRAYFGLDDKAEVWDAWRDMLKDELFKSYYANRDKS